MTAYRKMSPGTIHVPEPRLCAYAQSAGADESSKPISVLSKPSNDGRIRSSMVTQRKWLLSQNVSSGRQYSNNCASKVSSSATTPRQLFKTSRSFECQINKRLFEGTRPLATHAYRCSKSGVTVPVVQMTPTVRDASATIRAVLSVETFRVCGDRYLRAAYLDGARKSVCSRNDRPFLKADAGSPCGKTFCSQRSHSGFGK